MEAELGLIGAVWMQLGRFGDAESWNRNNRAYMWYAGPCSLSFCCMHAVQRRQRSRQRNWIKTHPFYYTPSSLPPSTPFSFTQRYLTPSLSPLKNPLFFSLQKTCGEERRRREEEEKNASEATREREREREEAEKVGSGTRGRGERGRPDGRKEGRKERISPRAQVSD